MYKAHKTVQSKRRYDTITFCNKVWKQNYFTHYFTLNGRKDLWDNYTSEKDHLELLMFVVETYITIVFISQPLFYYK